MALALVALALTGCETTAEKSAKLEKQAKLAAAHESRSTQSPAFTRPSAHVKVISAKLVRGTEGAAAIVTLRNGYSRPLRAVPIQITAVDSAGRTLYQNNAAGTEAALVSVSSIPAHGETTWVDDQIPSNGAPSKVTARVGEAPSVSGSVPATSVTGLHPIEDPANGAGASGTVSNRSSVVQRELVVFVLALRGGRVVAAARAVLPEVPAGGSAPFQVFFVGDPRGARLQASAPASTFG